MIPKSTKFTFDHMHVRVPDPEATALWFQKMFGAEVLRSTQAGVARIDVVLGGAYIFIASAAPGSGVNPNPANPYQGLDHFGLRVVGIDAIVAELKAKGAHFTVEPNDIRPGTRIAFLRSPDGVLIELLERTA